MGSKVVLSSKLSLLNNVYISSKIQSKNLLLPKIDLFKSQSTRSLDINLFDDKEYLYE